MDPVKGDKGWIQFAERDISTYKQTGERAIPPTDRMLSQSDGWYFPGVKNTPPEIWIRLREDGVFVEGKDQPVTVHTTGDGIVNCARATVNATGYAHIDSPVQAESCMDIYVQPGRRSHPYSEFQP